VCAGLVLAEQKPLEVLGRGLAVLGHEHVPILQAIAVATPIPVAVFSHAVPHDKICRVDIEAMPTRP